MDILRNVSKFLSVQKYKNIHLLDTRMMGLEQFCGAFIIEGKRNVMIDTGTKESSGAVIAYLQKQKIIPHYIIITHNHYDHIGGVLPILENFGYESITIIAGEIGKKRLINPNEINCLYTDEVFEPIEQVTVVEDNERLILEGMDLRILYTPGHSDDSISVYDNISKTIYPGDLIGDWLWGNTYLSPHITPDFSEEKYLRSNEKILSLDFSCTALHHYGFFIDHKAHEIFQKQLLRYREWKKILVPAWHERRETKDIIPHLKAFFRKTPLENMPNYEALTDAYAKWCIMGYQNSGIID